MLIYRDAPGQPVATSDACRELTAKAGHLASSTVARPDPAYTLAIELGRFEAAAADAASPEVEHVHANGITLREAAIAAADACLGAIAGDLDRLRSGAAVVVAALKRLDLSVLPDSLMLRTPEGFAYYGLYPETYAHAASQLASTERPHRAVCVGVRSIGTTLSAFAAAALQHEGCSVTAWTVRPTGHPFDRQVRLGDDVRRLLARPQPDVALVVDEGPGLSGSSFAATADALREIGIDRERIVLLPGWLPHAENLKSERAARMWPELRKVHVTFEQAWIESGRLAVTFGADALEDISAGKWRDVFFRRGPDVAVQPQHERRKYLARSVDGSLANARLLKFTGLGLFGDRALTRADHLRDLPVAVPSELRSGFGARAVIAGRPLASRDAGPKFITVAAQYVASIAERFALDTAAEREPLAALVETNAREALPESALPNLGPLLEAGRQLPDAPAVRLDARMLPHEWLLTRSGYVKVDAIEHHDDHFFPGPQDVAWDVAATIVEFELEPPAADVVTRLVGQRLRDSTLDRRMPFYTAAYVAFRTGYCTVASETAGGADGERLAAAAARYRSRLRAILE